MSTLRAFLLMLLSTFAFFLVFSRVDDLDATYRIDIVVGLLIGLLSMGPRIQQASRSHQSRWMTLMGVITVWGLVSGTLTFLHKHQMVIRSGGKTIQAKNQVNRVLAALQDYAFVSGDFPSQEQGLKALVHNPGNEKWGGPYLDANELVDPWGQPLRYRVDNVRIRVRSFGRDMLENTTDDIEMEIPIDKKTKSIDSK